MQIYSTKSKIKLLNWKRKLAIWKKDLGEEIKGNFNWKIKSLFFTTKLKPKTPSSKPKKNRSPIKRLSVTN